MKQAIALRGSGQLRAKWPSLPQLYSIVREEQTKLCIATYLRQLLSPPCLEGEPPKSSEAPQPSPALGLVFSSPPKAASYQYLFQKQVSTDRNRKDIIQRFCANPECFPNRIDEDQHYLPGFPPALQPPPPPPPPSSQSPPAPPAVQDILAR